MNEKKINVSMSETTTLHVSLFERSGGMDGSMDYKKLDNKPRINSVTLVGDKTAEDLRLQKYMDEVTAEDIDQMMYGI